jgi:hypothetical protein
VVLVGLEANVNRQDNLPDPLPSAGFLLRKPHRIGQLQHIVCARHTEAVKNASLYCYGGPQNNDDYQQSFGFEHVMPLFPNPFTPMRISSIIAINSLP